VGVMKSFNDWFNTYENLQCDKDSCEDAFEAGQQSKQAEVDELQKRIDVLRKKLNEMAHIFLDDLDEILKGNTNDH
jgi:TolA-binding protein